MEESTKHLQNMHNLDIQYLKSEKESLIKSNYAYSDLVSRMEIEISDLKAMLKATQNENLLLNTKIMRLQQDSDKFKQSSTDAPNIDLETTKNTLKKNLKEENDEDIQDLYEEVNELREENQYFKGQYIPKLENQLENARLLINELENELDCMNRENELMKKSFYEDQSLNESHRSVNCEDSVKEKRDLGAGKGKILEKVVKNGKQQRGANYVPSIKRFDRPTKPVEYTIQISKR